MKCVLHVVAKHMKSVPYSRTKVVTKHRLRSGPLWRITLTTAIGARETIRTPVKSMEHGAVNATQFPAHRTTPHGFDILERFMAINAFRVGRTFGPTKHHKLVFLVNVVGGFTVDTRGDTLQVGYDCKER